jgi:palmitoyltransferase ZDHHC9/14/18
MFFLSTVTNQLIASFANPGVIKSEGYVYEVSAETAKDENELDTLVSVRSGGSVLKLKFCKTCKIIRPPRSAHCKFCDFCVCK